MRIIAGSYRSRTLEAPPGLATRPTSDRLRETLFNVLAPRIQGAAFLDLYAGSGAVGIEALSRGAARVEFVERAQAALKVLRANLERLAISTGFRIHAAAAGATLRKIAVRPASREETGFDLVFLDPPYDAAQEYESTMAVLGGSIVGHMGMGDLRADNLATSRPRTGGPEVRLLAPGALVIAEHRRKERLEDRYGSLVRKRLLEQGDASLSFYQISSAAASDGNSMSFLR